MSTTSAPGPTVSVVIPVRDDARELARCLRLLADQTRPPDEVVVVDNGSTDDSVAVARAAGARVVREPHVGIPRAAATGYDAATGDLLARLDADSRPGRRWVEHAVRAMAEPEVDAATGPGHFVDLPRGTRLVASVAYLGSYLFLTWLAGANTPLWGSSMVLRRGAWQRVRGQVHRQADVHDDMDLALVLGPLTRVRFVPRLHVGVSGRSLHGRHQLRRRLDRAVTTLELNWADEPPWARWQRRLTR